MFARKVSVRLRPNALEKFTQLLEREILPWLRTQEGFLDLITLAARDGSEVQTISFWDQEANVQACNTCEYPGVLKNLTALLDGISDSNTFEVVSSTLARFVPPRSREPGSTVPDAGPSNHGLSSPETSI